MKKFTKILLGVILSVAVVVSGCFALAQNKDAYARNSIYIDGYGLVSSGAANGVITHGSHKQVSVDKTFTGLTLKAVKGVTYDLGTANIGSSDWAGTYIATAAGNNESMFECVYSPDQVGHPAGDTVVFNIHFTQGDKTMSIKVAPYYESSPRTIINYSAKTESQNHYGAYRDTKGWYFKNKVDGYNNGVVLKHRVTAKDYKNLTGIDSPELNIRADGYATATNAFYYDFNDVALYSWASYNSSTGLATSYVIRDFDEENSAYNGFETAWTEGFVKDADGNCMVDVSLEFVTATTAASIIITKIGDFDFSKVSYKPYEYNVKDGVETVGGTVTVGDFKQINADYTYHGINLTGAPGTKFTLGTMSINDTYFDDNWTFEKGTGIIDSATGNKYVTTTKGSTFPFFTGSNEAFTGVASDSRSFISFVLNTQEGTYDSTSELELFKITLREVGKPENFVTYHIYQYVEDYQGNSYREFLIKCTATNNTYVANERFRVTHNTMKAITLHENVRRVVNSEGAQESAISLFYDYSQNAAYTDVAFNGNTDGLGGAFRIRDFDDVSKKASDYYSIPSGIANWDGFSENAQVEISLEMGYQKTFNKNNSVIITSLMGYNFDDSALVFDENAEALVGAETDLNKFAGIKTGTVTYDYNLDVISSYKFEGETITSPYVFTEGGLLEYFDAEDNKLGEVNIETNDNINLSVEVANGRYVVLRDGSEVTEDFKFGDVVRFIPGKESVSKLLLSDVRSFMHNANSYAYDTENVENAVMPLTPGNEGGEPYYDFNVSIENTDYNFLKLSIVFDRYCKITVIDTEKPENEQETVAYRWAVDGTYSFPMAVAANTSSIARGSSTDKVLVAYARTDLAEKVGNSFRLIRNDIEYDVNTIPNMSLTYYNRSLGSQYYKVHDKDGISNISIPHNAMLSIVPDMVFETVYIKMWIDYEIKLVKNHTNDLSGLRFVVKFDKADIENYFRFVVDSGANKTGNPFGGIYNYVTTQGELNKGGAGVALDKISSSHWYKNGWNSASTANHLGLYNGTDKSAADMADKPGYVVTYLSGNADIWNDYIVNDSYYAYAVTVNGFKEANINKDYVFMPVVNIREFYGSATSFVLNAVTVKPSELATQKLNDVLLTTEPDYTYYTVNDGVNNYYTAYKAADIKWLASMAGDEREFYNGKIEA